MTCGDYTKNIVVGGLMGAAAGLAAGYLLNELKVYQAPAGGRVFCVFANPVPPNPLHINAGLKFTITADIPTDYVFKGPLVSRGMIPPAVMATGGVAVGSLVGAVKAHYSKP